MLWELWMKQFNIWRNQIFFSKFLLKLPTLERCPINSIYQKLHCQRKTSMIWSITGQKMYLLKWITSAQRIYSVRKFIPCASLPEVHFPKFGNYKKIKCCESFARWLLGASRCKCAPVGTRLVFKCSHHPWVQKVQMNLITPGSVWVSSPPLSAPLLNLHSYNDKVAFICPHRFT